ncbi:MAG: hypothetical protein WDZ37_07755 [Solirubrobacterales bacterium]
MAIAINLVLIAAAVPMFLYVLPTTHWQPQALATLLICAGMLSMTRPLHTTSTTSIDAAVAVSFVAILLLGPLVGLAVLIASEAVWALRVYTRSSVLINAVANTANHCWLCMVFSLVMVAGDFQPPDSLASMNVLLLALGAGLAACATNILLLGITCKTWDGVPFRHAILLDGHPGNLDRYGVDPLRNRHRTPLSASRPGRTGSAGGIDPLTAASYLANHPARINQRVEP